MKGAKAVAGLLLALTGGLLHAKDLSVQEVDQYMEAAAEVLSYQKMMADLPSVCGDSASKLSTVWNERNRKWIGIATTLRVSALAQIKKVNGAETAKNVEAKQNAAVAQYVSSLIGDFKSLPPDKKSHLCKRFGETVNNGEWDVETKSPRLYAFLRAVELGRGPGN